MPFRFTQSSINELTPRKSRYTVFDTEITGFGIRVGSGKKVSKIFILKYRNQSNTQKFMTIGSYGDVTLKQARDIAKKYKGQIAMGEDPQDDKLLNKKAMTIKQLAESYLDKGCSHKKPSTLKTDLGRLNRHILPLLKNVIVKDITRNNITAFYNNIASGKTATEQKTKLRGLARVTGGLGTARKAKSLLSAMLSFAVEEGIITTNPAFGLKLGSDNQNQRYLSPEEINKLSQILDDCEKSCMNLFAINAIRLLLLTGCRKGEVMNLTWNEVDLKKPCLNLENSKTGAKQVPISKSAIDLISNIPRIKGSSYVFPGKSIDKPYQGLQKFWTKIRKIAEIEDVRIHDLRHTFASIAITNGASLPEISVILGHSDFKTTSRYAHITLDHANQAANKTSEVITKIMKG